jgi:glycerol uptake facilitator-like aquaporin
MMSALKQHWPEYLIEGAGLGIFMVSACWFGALLEHPGSPARQGIPDPILRRALMGLAMGLTAIAIIYSPWGKQSGAHINPAVTLTFWRLGKVAGADAFFYIVAQFAGAVIGVSVSALIWRNALMHPSVNYVVTLPTNRRDFHQRRSAVFRDEHEPGAFLWIGGGGSNLEDSLGLFHRATAGNDAGGGSLPAAARQSRRIVRQISSP